MTSVYLAKNVIKCREQHWKKTWRCGTSQNSTATAPCDHTMWFVFDNKMINYQRIWLKFYQPLEHLLFYISYKSCKQSLMSIDFIASVYELFDNPSYVCKLLCWSSVCGSSCVLSSTCVTRFEFPHFDVLNVLQI